jgi:hypothetical protein
MPLLLDRLGRGVPHRRFASELEDYPDMHNGNAAPTVMQLASSLQSKFQPVLTKRLTCTTHRVCIRYWTEFS